MSPDDGPPTPRHSRLLAGLSVLLSVLCGVVLLGLEGPWRYAAGAVCLVGLLACVVGLAGTWSDADDDL